MKVCLILYIEYYSLCSIYAELGMLYHVMLKNAVKGFLKLKVMKF